MTNYNQKKSLSSFPIILSILSLLTISGCYYSRNFGSFYESQMEKVDSKYGSPYSQIIKTVEAPFYLVVYLYGGLGALMDSKNWDKNFPFWAGKKCFKKVNNNLYEVFDFNFKKSEQNLIKKESYQCLKERGLNSFMATFLLNDPQYKYEDGNSIALIITLSSYEEKINKNQVYDLLNVIAQKPLSEVLQVNQGKEPRYSNATYKTSDIMENEKLVCRTTQQSIRDLKAPNTPKDTDYLIQKNFQKLCYQADYNLLISASISFRVVPSKIKDMNQKIIDQKLEEMLNNFTLKDGTSLSRLLKIKEH